LFTRASREKRRVRLRRREAHLSSRRETASSLETACAPSVQGERVRLRRKRREAHLSRRRRERDPATHLLRLRLRRRRCTESREKRRVRLRRREAPSLSARENRLRRRLVSLKVTHAPSCAFERSAESLLAKGGLCSPSARVPCTESLLSPNLMRRRRFSSLSLRRRRVTRKALLISARDPASASKQVQAVLISAHQISLLAERPPLLIAEGGLERRDALLSRRRRERDPAQASARETRRKPSPSAMRSAESLLRLWRKRVCAPSSSALLFSFSSPKARRRRQREKGTVTRDKKSLKKSPLDNTKGDPRYVVTLRLPSLRLRR